MTSKFDMAMGAGLSRRNFLKTSAGAALVAGTAGGLVLPGAAKADTGLVALVHTQAAGDNGPIDSMIAALKKLSGEKGFPIRTIYAQDSATFPSIFESLADAGAEVIAATFNEVAEPIKELAPKYPDTKFIQIFGDPFDPPMPNVVTVSYDYYLGCYLSGLFASKVSKTGKIGYIGGVSLPPLNADLNAMKAAAASVGADKTVTGAFAGSFQDPAKGHEIANQMYQDGIDYIQTDSAATDTGIIQAANEGDGSHGQRHLAGAVQARAEDRGGAGRPRFRPVALQRGREGDRPRLQGRSSLDRPWHRRHRLRPVAELRRAGPRRSRRQGQGSLAGDRPGQGRHHRRHPEGAVQYGAVIAPSATAASPPR